MSKTRFWSPVFICWILCLSGVVCNECRQECTSTECIRSYDWANAGSGWGTLKDIIVEECETARTARLTADKNGVYFSRHAVWEDFKMFQENVTNNPIEEDDGRLYRLLYSKFISLKNRVEKGERKIEDIIKSSKDKTTNYQNQAIVILQNDRVVRDAAINLFYKHPDVSTMYFYDQKSKKYTLVAGKEQTFGKNSRIQVVGHSGDASGEMLFAKLKGEQLANVLSKIPGIQSTVKRIGLVGCEAGKSKKFLSQFMRSLQNDLNIKTTVSARKGVVAITDSGRKLVGEITENGLVWPEKSNDEKFVLKLDKNNQLVKIDEPPREYVKRSCDTCTQNLLIDDVESITDIKKLKITEKENGKSTNDGDRSENVVIEQSRILIPEIIDKYLTKETSNMFKKTFNDLIDNANGFEIRDIDIYNNIVTYETDAQKRVEKQIAASIANENVKVFDGNGVNTQTEVRVRRFETPQQFIDEINLWGLIGPLEPVDKPSIPPVYYGIGKYVYRMNPRNFYIHFHGVSTDFDWEWQNKHGIDVNYEHANLEKYGDLRQKIDKPNILSVIGDLLDGNIEKLNKVAPVDMVYSLASGFSETIRNFRNYPVLKHAIALHKANKLSVDMFLDINPMTRGGSWNVFGTSDHRTNLPKIDSPFPLKNEVKKTGFYGFDDSTYEQRSKLKYFIIKIKKVKEKGITVPKKTRVEKKNPVLMREINIVQHHIMHQLEDKADVEAIDDESNLSNLEPLTIDELKPILGESVISQDKPEELKSQFDILQERYEFSDQKITAAHALRLDIMLQMDQIYLERLVSNDFQKFLEQTDGDYFLVKDSIDITDGEIRYSVQNKHNNKMVKDLAVKYKKSELQIHQMLDNLNKRRNTKLQYATETAGRINDLLDFQGILSGFGSVIDNFQNGNIKEGSIALAQSVHGSVTFAAELTGLSKSIRKGIGSFSKKALTSIKKHVSSAVGAIKQLSTLGKAGKIFLKIPFVSLGFGIYSAITNFQQGTALGYINFGFDILGIIVSTAAIKFPPLEIVSLALAVIQIGFNEFWNSISSAYKELGPSATIGQKVVAVLKGIGVGIKNLFQQFTLIGQIWGAVEQVSNIKRQYRQDQEFLRKLRDINNYYTLETRGNQGIINFAAGSYSWNGGDILFRLGENGCATVTTIPKTYLGHLQMKLNHNYQLSQNVYVGKNTNSIVAGFGQTNKVKYTRQTAKILFFIPVYSKDLISGFKGDLSTLRGIYYGNSKNNTFYTVQELPDDNRDKFHYTLKQYSYELYGMDGDDMFFLGPQTAHVDGGPGYDYYYVPAYGGSISINNYAEDMKNDILYIDCKITDFCAKRDNSDLMLTYHASHFVKVENWYKSEKYRHMSFRADDGVIFNISQTAFGKPRIEALAVIMQDETSGINVNIDTIGLQTVALVVGSDHNDYLTGNSGQNKIIGGKGNDYMIGKNGKDVYEINAGEGCDTIDNYAADGNMDMLFLSSKYSDIFIRRQSDNLLLTGRDSVCVYLKNWFISKAYRHLTFLSGDGILFEVNNTRKTPFTVYMDRFRSRTVNISTSEYSLVRTVIGSSQSDTIYGNRHGNVLNGGKGNDFISGGEGPDSYVIREDGNHDTINNFADDKELDIIFFQELYSNIKVSMSVNDLVVKSLKGFSATIKNWFKDERFQHMKVRTSDGVEFFFPVSKENFIGKIPITIDKSEYSRGVRLDTNDSSWKTVIKIIGSNYTDVIYGNLQNNIIEPGQGGGFFAGNNGSDKYTIKSDAGSNNIINNLADDDNTDVIKMDADFEDINVTDIFNTSLHLVGPNDLGITIESFLEGTEYQHLIIESADGISFGVNGETLAVEPLAIDKTNTVSDQVIDTDNDELQSTKKIFGSLIQPNEITGNLEDNTIVGGNNVDTLKGSMGNDYLHGGNGQDILMGGDGDDTLIGGEGSDWISGDFGNDTIFAGEGADSVVGGFGSDTVVLAGNISAQIGVFVDIQSGRGISSDAEGDIYIGIENIVGTEFDDILIGNDGDNEIFGFGGNDIIFPNGGNDILNGGNGNDIYALESSTGIKYLVLETTDNSSDIISLMNSTRDQIRVHRNSKNHLMLQIGYKNLLQWCPNENNFGPFLISNWFQYEKNQNVWIILDDFRIGKAWLEENIHDGDINQFQEFICQNPTLVIAIICLLVMLTTLICFYCLYKCCRDRRNYQNIPLQDNPIPNVEESTFKCPKDSAV